MILDGERLTREMFGERLDPREHLIRLYPDVAERIPPLGHVVATAAPLVARVNHGVWIAPCPCGARGTPSPGGVVFFDTPLVCCARCGNQGVGGGWRRVEIPPENERALIEMVLLCRPNVEDRNWEPGESVADLIAQNAAHGDPVPAHIAEAALGPVQGPTWQETVAPIGPPPEMRRTPRWWQRLAGRR